MTSVIRVPSATFTQPGLPVIRSFSDRIMSLPNLTMWFNGAPSTVIRDTDNRLVSWRDRSPRGTTFSKSAIAAAQNPLFVPNAYMGRNALRFTKERGDALTWSGQRAIGNNRLTSIIIATISPIAATNHQLLSDITPSSGWNALYVQKASGGAVSLVMSTGNAGSVGKTLDISNFANTGRPMLIVTVVDAFYGALKMRINSQAPSITSASPVLAATDVNIGATGGADTLPGLGIDMDLYEVITMQNDILAAGNEEHMANILEYARVAYGIV